MDKAALANDATGSTDAAAADAAAAAESDERLEWKHCIRHLFD